MHTWLVEEYAGGKLMDKGNDQKPNLMIMGGIGESLTP